MEIASIIMNPLHLSLKIMDVGIGEKKKITLFQRR